MILALPGGQGFFTSLYTGLSQRFPDHRIRISPSICDSLLDLQFLAEDLATRPTRLGEIVDTLPVAYSAADACGVGMGGVWFSTDPTFSPMIWRSTFDVTVIPRLVTTAATVPVLNQLSRLLPIISPPGLGFVKAPRLLTAPPLTFCAFMLYCNDISVTHCRIYLATPTPTFVTPTPRRC